MHNSLTHFLEKPVVQQTKTTSFQNIERPIIYVCQENQFNYAKALENGYKTVTAFTLGRLDKSDKVSWKGIYDNKTFQELLSTIFETDYSGFNAQSYDVVGNRESRNTIDTDEIYMVPYGFCKKLKQSRQRINIAAEKSCIMLAVDPAKENAIRITNMENGKGEFGPINDEFFVGYNYEIEISIHDSNLYNGITCVDYGKLGTSYGECIENVMRSRLNKLYGCTPPWFPVNKTEITCSDANGFVDISDKELLDETNEEFNRFIKGLDLKMFKSCLPPCITMSMKRKELLKFSNKLNNGYFHVAFLDTVTVLTDVYAYDVFSLIVDLGSALGLWLGLSALTIFDVLMHVLSNVKRGKSAFY